MFNKNEIIGNYRIIRPLGKGGMMARRIRWRM